mmetsp:Transcript_35192/g.115884  ORF Transcript_35192/g.115884 Transcript_35192/m.115884 type:complete len:101 (-) Transcript_35192:53-355(-)
MGVTVTTGIPKGQRWGAGVVGSISRGFAPPLPWQSTCPAAPPSKGGAYDQMRRQTAGRAAIGRSDDVPPDGRREATLVDVASCRPCGRRTAPSSSSCCAF